MKDVGIFYRHVVYFTLYFMVIWYVFPFWYVVCTNKDLASLLVVHTVPTLCSDVLCKVNSELNLISQMQLLLLTLLRLEFPD
jgi:hypothetical protein